ncbi:DUF4249 domain-containing protein [Marinoscillum sp. MHG1-6]|uniref:DUF4249 domain-containing protein n=1 Tax=Marinoscillum sp. MHG1-6 TaxID=2959627 RepID=UPI0021578F9E|nr:DUF4249 domain-containing protein [Marinoscillum sp. MHG1-6]
MITLRNILVLILAGLGILACEKKIDVDLEESEAMLVVDAWLTNQFMEQEITLAFTRHYFDESQAPEVLGADVIVVNIDQGDTLLFEDLDGDGSYTWDAPGAGKTLGSLGDNFLLSIDFEGVHYEAMADLSGSPSIDSITFEYEPKDAFINEDYYYGEFWARDLEGVGDTYWIKSWKNGVYLNQPNEMNLAYDAAFSRDGADAFDALFFIQPIRTAMNPFDEKDGEFLPPYSKTDTAYVEIHSLSEEAWFFLMRVMEETNVSGGFGALFATPLANVPTNISSSNPEVGVVGFFNVADVTSKEEIVTDATIRDNNPE